MWKRLRVWIARRLMRGTECTVARRNLVGTMQSKANEMREYIQRSGGAQAPDNIRAYRIMFALASEIWTVAANIEAQS